MNTQNILERLDRMEKDLTEITDIANKNQIAKIIEVMEEYNQHPIIINYMKWNLGAIISLVVIGIMGLFLALNVYLKVCV